MILGHAHAYVVDAICSAASRGTSYGAPSKSEVEPCRNDQRAIPAMEMLRMVSSGTEAVMSAVRLARAFTRRDKIMSSRDVTMVMLIHFSPMPDRGWRPWESQQARACRLPAALTLTLPYNNIAD